MNKEHLDVSFVKSSEQLSQCPPANLPEYAFIGRSNVGKSSLINYLADRKKLAMISSKPGKTKLINHFVVNDSWYLVDLPGYGYAVIAKSERKKFEKMIRNYVQRRENLVNVFILVDANVTPQKLDLEFMEWMGLSEIPFTIVFTKADKSAKQKVADNIERYKKTLLEAWVELPDLVITSATDKLGKEEIFERINRYNIELSQAIEIKHKNKIL